MKLCIISTSVFRCPPQGYAGLEMIAWLQAKGLAEKGHEVALIAPEGSACSGVTVIPTGPEGQWDERQTYSTYWQHLFNYDVIVDHSWNKWSLNLKIEGKLKSPVLQWMHAPVSTMIQSLPPVEKPCFVCISEDQRSHFEALFSHPARTCLNGIDLNHYRPMAVPRSKRYLFLARFSTIKGPAIGIEACMAAGAGLDLVGDTSITNEPAYFEQCRAACDGKQIRMVGPASRGQCVWWFSQAHAMLHPNKLFREPLGLAPLEAQACGTPVIAWRYGACKETILDGVSGFLVDSVGQMTELIGTDAVRGLSREKCREWASQFSVERMVDRTEALCVEALDTGGW